MEQTRAFLDLVLPDDGYRVAFVAEQKRNYFFNTNKELAAFLLQWDAAGYTVYHACASFKDPNGYDDNGKWKYRGQGNVAFLAALFADIDCGEEKSYSTALAGACAVITALPKIKLPTPLFVCSGRGLHIYWPLGVQLEPGEWRRYAIGLRAALRSAGIQFDPARTCDSASILRTPGTHNRKETKPLPVTMGPEVDFYEVNLFAHLLELVPGDEHVLPFQTIEAPKYLNRSIPDYIIRNWKSGIGARQNALGRKISEHCAQLRGMRETRGLLAEPLWHACLGVLAFCEDGDQLAHEWSIGDERYSEQQTDEKLRRKRELTGATTCADFHAKNPKPCEACSHWQKIKSPISLGIGLMESRPTASPQITPQGSSLQALTNISLPRHFAWRNAALVFQTENNGQPIEHLVSQYPIYLFDVARDETSEEISLAFQCWLPNGGWFKCVVPFEGLMANNGLGHLTRYGINIHEAEHFKRFVRASVDMAYEQGKLRIRYQTYGWKHDGTAFLFGSKLYSATEEVEVYVSPEMAYRNRKLGPGCNAPKKNAAEFGLDRWCQAANQLFALRCEPQAIALLASLSAVLMRFIAVDEGGAVLSLFNYFSGKGKSTGLAAAYTIWGDKTGLSLTVKDNQIAKFLTFGTLGNIPVVHDELQMRDPGALRDFIETFTDGQDKKRATREGQLKRQKGDWQTVLVSGGNTSLVQTIDAAGGSQAMRYRVLEMTCDLPVDIMKEGDIIKLELINNAGYFGEVFIRYVVQNIDKVKAQTQSMLAQVWQKTELSHEYRFWVRLAACCAVSANIIKELGLLAFSADRIIGWLLEYMKENGKKEHKLRDPDTQFSQFLSEFISEENQNFLYLPHEWKRGQPRLRPLREPKGKLLGSYFVGDQLLVVSATALRTFSIKREIPFNDWMAVLRKHGCATDIHQHIIGAGTDLPPMSVNAITFNMAHETLGGVLPISKDDDPTNVTPLHRR